MDRGAERATEMRWGRRGETGKPSPASCRARTERCSASPPARPAGPGPPPRRGLWAGPPRGRRPHDGLATSEARLCRLLYCSRHKRTILAYYGERKTLSGARAPDTTRHTCSVVTDPTLVCAWRLLL